MEINSTNSFTEAIVKQYPEGKFIFEGDLFAFGNPTQEIGIILWSEFNLHYGLIHFSKSGQEGDIENINLRERLRKSTYLGNYFKNPEILDKFIGYKINFNELV